MKVLSLLLLALALGCASPRPEIVWIPDGAEIPFGRAKSICFARHLQYISRYDSLSLAESLYRQCMEGYGYAWMTREQFRTRCDDGALPHLRGCSLVPASNPRNP